MTRELTHDPGCNQHHRPRQQCNGPIAEARRRAPIAPPIIVDARRASPSTSVEESGAEISMAWLEARWVGAALEALPGIAIAVIWLGSRPASVQYSDFSYLVLVALAPSIGWFWRGGIGCAIAPALWSVRLILLFVAADMWGAANDHSPFRFSIGTGGASEGYRETCCGPTFELGMHAALLAAIATSLISAYAVRWWQPRHYAEAFRSDNTHA